MLVAFNLLNDAYVSFGVESQQLGLLSKDFSVINLRRLWHRVLLNPALGGVAWS